MGVTVRVVSAQGISVRLADMTFAEYEAFQAWAAEMERAGSITVFSQANYVSLRQPRQRAAAGRATRSRRAASPPRAPDAKLSTLSDLPPDARILICAPDANVLYETAVSSDTPTTGREALLTSVPLSHGFDQLEDDPALAGIGAHASATVRRVLARGVYDDWLMTLYA